MRNVRFVAVPDEDGNRDGENGFEVEVDGKMVIDQIDDLDVSNHELDPLWHALGISVEFEED